MKTACSTFFARAERWAQATQGPLDGPAEPARVPSGDSPTCASGEGLT